MAFPDVTTLIDGFNRADGAVNAGGGSTIWSSTPVVPGSPILNILSNALDHTVGGAECASVNQFGPDVDFHWTVAGNAQIDASHYLACYFAFQGVNTSSFSGYGLIGGLTATANEWTLHKYTAGSGSTVGSFGVQAIALGDSVGISMRGSTIKAKYKAAAGSWVDIGTITDATFNRAGSLGFEVAANGLDDLRGGTFIAGSGSTKGYYSGSADVYSGNSDVLGPSTKVFSGNSDVLA